MTQRRTHADGAMWQREFGRAYMVPPEIAEHPALIDTSWHNDAMPSFTAARYEDEDGAEWPRLWVDHVDPAEREWPTWPRYGVSAGETTHYSGDDMAEALRVFFDVANACPSCGAAVSAVSRDLCDACHDEANTEERDASPLQRANARRAAAVRRDGGRA